MVFFKGLKSKVLKYITADLLHKAEVINKELICKSDRVNLVCSSKNKHNL